ncbi:RrF2 family transcriptional regulator [Dictyoglomus thermophilum]|uniref:RRF2 protein family n=2 Tax=Dictyoglomus thermophilum TaxID=14 RepID=B5YEN8_DICT6|nr:Rrf2 family transcriptional regulator [Dictyoglomus thermophilum]ACI18761.1 RRF2 protein family [Dictyoglomus thermophilum H-6-12]MCX7719747.1 Rrf2 family transcriptional regulator [Dictyoglomus thermophilum]TYT21179.1 Rrf2 family transcriptional regulator [Dictyoglomus thermophilum]
MKLSTRSRYGLRALIYIAKNQKEDSPVSVRKIAEAEEIPLRYLERIMRILSQKNYVRAEVGAEGGYYLNISPENIRILDVVEALEGRINLVDCLHGVKCKRMPSCPTRPLWIEMTKSLKETLAKYTLADFLKEEEKIK